jgi:antitoxin HicB
MRRYSVVLLPDAGQFTVVVPALPGCVTQGTTIADALDAARDAIALYLEDTAAQGEPIPEEDGPALMCVLDV